MQHTKGRLGEVLKKKWKNKVMHGQYIRNMDRQLISEEDMFLWLSKGDLKAETESEIVAAQDQALNRKYFFYYFYFFFPPSMQQSVLGHLAAVMTGMTMACRGYIQRVSPMRAQLLRTGYICWGTLETN